MEKGSTLINRTYLENKKEIIRKCLICQELFATTVGGPHICLKLRCQKTRNGYVPRIHPVHLPSDLTGTEKNLSYNEQAEEIVEVEIDVLKPDTARIETARLLAERSAKNVSVI